MRFNPAPLLVIFFLTVGLVWSGGHVAWLIALGVYVLFAVVVTASEQYKESNRRR